MVEPIAPGPLRSELLRGNLRLQQCAQVDASHVRPLDPPSPHVQLIQEALRQVFGADIPSSENNYGDFTTKAVVAFKSDRSIFTRGTADKVDPIVGINTIRKLDELLAAEDDRRKKRGGGGEVTPLVVVRPDGPNVGEADKSGFSAARLTRNAAGDEWSRRDALKPISQFVPAGGRRKLIVEVRGGGGVTFSVDRAQIASIESSDQSSVVLRGNADGHALLTIAVEGGTTIKVALVVRAAKSIPVEVIHLGPPRVPGAGAAFQSTVLQAINAIYKTQTNITFTAGDATRVITTMVMDGVNTAIDTDLPLFFTIQAGPSNPNRPTMRFSDLQREATNSNAVTCFVSPNIHDEEGENITGRGGVRSKVCWFKIGASGGQSQRGAPAHEIGHALGLPHITAFGTEAFLMHPTGDVQQNNTIIPSETIDDFIL